MRALSETMVEFWDEGEHQRDHEAFKKWQRKRENRASGYVLNYPPDDLIISHKVGCSHIWDFSKQSASLTVHRKVCSADKSELRGYAGKQGEDWRLCDTCRHKFHSELR